jgi:hypothetical protein
MRLTDDDVEVCPPFVVVIVLMVTTTTYKGNSEAAEYQWDLSDSG